MEKSPLGNTKAATRKVEPRQASTNPPQADIARVGEEQIRRIRRICATLPDSTEKLSHGEPTFFVGKKVYAMFANNHHNDGHVAVWIPVEPGYQATLLKTSADKYFYPPYVGVKGWIGVELERIADDELAMHLLDAWRLIAPKQPKGRSGPLK